MNIKEILIENPVIAALRNNRDLENVINSKALIVFVLYGNIMSISKICHKLKQANKIAFVHLDMIEGLKGDPAGIEYIKEHANPAGIITTKSSNIKYAKQLGFYTIQRVFIIDSLFLKTGIKNIHETGPNAVEVMPGVASKIIHNMEKQINVPIIAGGLIKTKKDVMDSLAAGAIAISTTSIDLWNL
ncbi:glycerol uptake operon antiterminator [Clostridium tetanomorphum]|uniref:Glycerol-3-phosphate responsive antiterminator n=1 Tax=Clostridium tetanomorphum TaxID=1553 RepID=A0A923J0N4_CLOTT|nr:glycerol-3-phosphate responsive antiterminator [Clostridium tetanomorphum]KAJ53455.1 glycerol uptake operon antiterminator regulatory protein [Clostridium tetanomorphum DSM 665]MBC2398471.1 glycerol-3-phosphate responsive antiterminator [Clostridium tetanomorphum]MBP1865316.1 glycerol uptake operon antiterminator [Clostridium tetanomorphum]NRS85239.1 glycerol uptake operon antiterminator [Clostridium tetanomorphum]NRZ98416.1 glycerol uptake operon antiterminator [Clostridium tetanomorphum]